MVGVAFLTGDGTLKPLGLGDILILVAAIARAVHVTCIHKLTEEKPLDSLHLTTVQLATCAVLFAATSLVFGESIPLCLSHLDPAHWLSFLYLVVICTVCAFFIQTWAIRRTSPSRVSLLLGTEPLWAAAIGVTIAHDALAPIGYVGMCLVLAGIGWG